MHELFNYPSLPCEGCGTKDKPRSWISGLTAYHSDLPRDHPDHPNRNVYLCEECEKQYTEHWTSMWDEYYNSVGY